MSDKQIAALFGSIGFKIDDRNLIQFHQRMQKVSREMQALGNLADGVATKLQKVTGKSAKAGGLNTSQLAKDVARLEVLLAKVAQAKARAQTQFNREALSAGKLVHAGKADELKLNRGQLDIERQRLTMEKLRQTTAQQAQSAELKMQDVRRRMAERQALYEQRAHNLSLAGQQRILRVQREGTALQQAQFRLETMQAREIERRARRTPSETFSRSRPGMGGGGPQNFSLGFAGGLGAFALGLGFATSVVGSWTAALQASMAALQGQQYAVAAAAGGGASGEQANRWLHEYANSRGMDRSAISDQYAGFLASGKGAGLSNETTQGVFSGFGDLFTSLHLSSERQKGSLYAISQMIGKGQVKGEELNQQLSDHLPGAKSLFAEAYAQTSKSGLTGQKALNALDAAITAGKVKLDTVLRAAEIARQRAAPTVDASSKTAQAEQNRANNRKGDATLAFAHAGGDKANAEFFKRMDTMWFTLQTKAPQLAKIYSNLSILAANAVTNMQSLFLSSDTNGLLPALTQVSYVLAEISNFASTFVQVFSGKRGGAVEALSDYLPEKDAVEFLARLDRVATAWTKFTQALKVDMGDQSEYFPGLSDFLKNTAREIDGLTKLAEKALSTIRGGRIEYEDQQLADYRGKNLDGLKESQLSPYNQYRLRQDYEGKPILGRDAWTQKTLLDQNLNQTTGIRPIPSLASLPMPEWAERGMKQMLQSPNVPPLPPTPNGLTTAQQLGVAPITLNLDLKVENAHGMDENDLARQLSLTLPAAVQDGLRQAVGSMSARQSENE
jgi:tape measure domain-containing protein